MGIERQTTVRFITDALSDLQGNGRVWKKNEFILVRKSDGSIDTSQMKIGDELNTYDNLAYVFAFRNKTAAAINATGTATAAQVKGGLITSTSAATTSITLPTATLLATALGAVQGYSFDFTVDNSGGASVVTVVVGTGIIAASVLTGGTTLTIAAGAVGTFRVYFKSTTTANIARLV